LLDGVCDGEVTFAEIAKHGEFGLGKPTSIRPDPAMRGLAH
jgi:alpha-acetolactate decarboxylase